MSEDNVIRLVQPVGDGVVVNCDNVLDAAKGQLSTVLVVGLCTDDGSTYVASSHGVKDAVFLAELAKMTALLDAID